jgi:hypothetical protein
MKLVSFNLLSLALAAFSPSAWSAPTPPEAIYLKNALSTLSQFLGSEQGQSLFGLDFSAPKFAAQAEKVEFQFTDANQPLLDRFGQSRCLLNGVIANTIQVRTSEDCLRLLQKRSIEFYGILFHEVLNQIDVELPLDGVGSQYEVSRKLTQLPSEAIEGSRKFVLHPNCVLRVADMIDAGFPYGIPGRTISILYAKGYYVTNNMRYTYPENDPLFPKPLILKSIATYIPGRPIKSAHEYKRNFSFTASLVLPHGSAYPNAHENELRIDANPIIAKANMWVTPSGDIKENEVLEPEKVARALYLSLPQCVSVEWN